MKNTAGIIGAFIGGIALGALIGLLFAPQSGEETRKKIAEALAKRGINLSDEQLNDFINDLKTEAKTED